MFYVTTPCEGKSFLVDSDNANVIRSYKSDPSLTPCAASFHFPSGNILVAESKSCIFTFSPSMSQAVQKSFTSERISVMAVSPCGSFVAGGGAESGCIFIWSALTGELYKLLKAHIKAVTFLKFSGCGQYLASTSSDTSVKIWEVSECLAPDAPNPQIVASITSHTLSVNWCAFLPEHQIASCSDDRTLKVHNIKNKTQLASISTPCELTCLTVVGSCAIVAGGSDGSLLMFRLDMPEHPYTRTAPFPEGHTSKIVRIWSVSPQKFVAASKDGKVLEWSVLSSGIIRLCREVANFKKGLSGVTPIPLRASRIAKTATTFPQLLKYPISNDAGFSLPPCIGHESEPDLKKIRTESLIMRTKLIETKTTNLKGLTSELLSVLA